MNGKPTHYDGSIQGQQVSDSVVSEPFVLTDEMRTNISGNPYSVDKVE